MNAINKLTLTLLTPALGFLWTVPGLQARNCGGSNRNLGFGGNIYPFEVPSVEETVQVDGFLLKVDRVKWSIQRMPKNFVAAVFKDKNTTIRALRLPPLSPQQTLHDLASATAASAHYSDRVRFEDVRTTLAIPGVKAIYRGRPNLLNEDIQFVRYYFQEKSGRIICFEVFPTNKFPNWSDANKLILNTLKQARLS